MKEGYITSLLYVIVSCPLFRSKGLRAIIWRKKKYSKNDFLYLRTTALNHSSKIIDYCSFPSHSSLKLVDVLQFLLVSFLLCFNHVNGLNYTISLPLCCSSWNYVVIDSRVLRTLLNKKRKKINLQNIISKWTH